MDPLASHDDIQADTQEQTLLRLSDAVVARDNLGMINALGVLCTNRWPVPPSVLGPLLLAASQYDDPSTLRVLIKDQARAHCVAIAGKKNAPTVGPLAETWAGVTAHLAPDVGERAHHMVRTAVEWGYSDGYISQGAVQMLLGAKQHTLLADWMTEAAQTPVLSRSSALPSPASVLIQAAVMDCMEVVEPILGRQLVHGAVLCSVATTILENSRGSRAHLRHILPQILAYRIPALPDSIAYELFSLISTLKQALGIPGTVGLGLCEDIVSCMDTHEVQFVLQDPTWMFDVFASFSGINWGERAPVVTAALQQRCDVLELEAATKNTSGAHAPPANRRM